MANTSTYTTGAMTLAQWANMTNDPLVYQFTKSLLTLSNPLNDIPIVTKPSLKMNGQRLVTAPTINWRALNASAQPAQIAFTPFQESAYIVSNTLDVDVKLLQDENWITDPRAARLMAWAEGLNFDFANKFINNDHITGDQNGIVGLRARLNQQSLYGTNAKCLIDGGGVDLSNGGISAANAATMNSLVRQALDEVGSPDGTGCCIYMNRDLRRRWERGLRLAGAGAGFDMVHDAYDRRVAVFDNAIIRPLGTQADQATEIITSTETSTGAAGSSTYTSFYVVRYGQGSLQGWQMDNLKVQDIGQIPAEPSIYRLFVDWAVGLWQEHTRAVARVYDIKTA